MVVRGERANTNMNTKTNSERALESYRAHLNEAANLLLSAMHELDVRKDAAKLGEITWASEGSMQDVKNTAVELAWKLGLITSEEAKAKHGVIL